MKAFRLFTGHQTSPTVLHKDIRDALGGAAKKNRYYKDMPAELVDELWRRFIEALAPLRAASKLGLVHFQFSAVAAAQSAGSSARRAVRRAHGWPHLGGGVSEQDMVRRGARESTLAFERELGVVHTIVDGPQGFSNSVPTIWEATHPRYALLRLHGRNTETWNIKGATAASDRFNYDYGDDELRDVAGNFAEVVGRVEFGHAVFNNNFEDQGQRNAAAFCAIMADIPSR